MGIARGPNIIKDNLVFGYDSGYGVADNQTSTRFFKGKPTENLLALAGADTDLERSGGAPSYAYHSVNITSYVQSRWTSSNNRIVQSFEGKRDYVGGGTGGGNDGYPRIYVYFTDWSWSSSFGISSYDWSYGNQILTMPNPAGKNVYMSIYHMNSQNPGRSYSRKHSVSFSTIDTPYVSGTRSSTDSLIDLKRATNIDVSNVSFDSTGQPDMDGSNEYVDLGSDIEISSVANAASNGWTAEYVFNSDSASTLQHFNGCEEDVHNAGWIALYQGKLQVWNRSPGIWKKGDTVFASDTWYHIAFVQVNGTTMQFYVNGVAEGGDHVSYSWNPSKAAFFARYVGRYEHSGSYSRYFNGNIPVTRLYNKALTASEIKQNYKAFKSRFNI